MQKILEIRVVIDVPRSVDQADLARDVRLKALAEVGRRGIPFHHAESRIRLATKEEQDTIILRRRHMKLRVEKIDVGYANGRMLMIGIGVCGSKAKLKNTTDNWDRVDCLNCLRKKPDPQMRMFEDGEEQENELERREVDAVRGGDAPPGHAG